MKHLIFSLLTLLMVLPPAHAEGEYVHPRVHELEEKLSESASSFLKGRFPSVPFLVTIKLDPVYRSERSYDAMAKGERLPYFDLDSEEIRDEWDDPEKSSNQLMSRIRKAVVSVSIPNSVSEPEMNEIKDSLFILLHLNKARDEIVIQRRSWQTQTFDWQMASILSLAMAALLGGLFLINRTSSTKIAKALADSRSTSAGGGGYMASAPVGAPAPRTNAERNSSGFGGNVKVNDPLKLKDIVGRIVETLSKHNAFPNRFDLFELDEFGRENPQGLGAVLVEFPLEIRQKLFAYGFGEWWLEGLTHPGMLDFDSLEVFQKLMRNHRDKAAMEWDALVLSVWRLDTQRADFIRALPVDDAFAILHAMPKGVALTTARKAFPGNWAGILRSDSVKKVGEAGRISDLTSKAQNIKALNDMSLLERYRQELELSVHLKSADPYEEREIYDVLPSDSTIKSNRPPFYVVFEQSEAVLKRLIPALSIEQWAAVLADVRTADRGKVENLFSEKQKFLYAEKSRALASIPGGSDAAAVGELREQVARRMQTAVAETNAQEQNAKMEADRFNQTMKRRRGEIDELKEPVARTTKDKEDKSGVKRAA